MAKTVPIIDLTPYLDGTDKNRVALQVAEACRDTGFLVISGHGVPRDVIDDMLQASERFFALPDPTKRDVKPDDASFRGYIPMAGSSLSQSLGLEAAPDLREGFSINRVNMSNPYFVRTDAGMLHARNVWPNETDVPTFQEKWTAYYQAQERLATQLMRIFALALELPEHFFDDKVDRHFSNLVAYHYPPISEAPKPGQLRGGQHTDFGSLTLVYGYPSARGLQVWDGEGWLDVPVVPDTFVVNLGDLMAQWTNDLWVSTLHRVANPPDGEWDRSRYSLVFFHQPNFDLVVESLDHANPPKYPPVTSGEHLFAKLSAMAVTA